MDPRSSEVVVHQQRGHWKQMQHHVHVPGCLGGWWVRVCRRVEKHQAALEEAGGQRYVFDQMRTAWLRIHFWKLFIWLLLFRGLFYWITILHPLWVNQINATFINVCLSYFLKTINIFYSFVCITSILWIPYTIYFIVY